MSFESVMPSNHLILCHHLLLLPSVFPSIRVFSSELALCIRWPKYWGFSFSISPSNKYSELIAFRIDLFDLLVAQRTLKSLLQHHSSKASMIRLSTLGSAKKQNKQKKQTLSGHIPYIYVVFLSWQSPLICDCTLLCVTIWDSVYMRIRQTLDTFHLSVSEVQLSEVPISGLLSTAKPLFSPLQN